MADTPIAGRYRLDELLGQTGMSEVWLATDLELGRRVALKLLAPNADTARFDREARAVASLGHPNITQLYDYGEEDGRPYMVLEYLPGGTLEDRLRDGRRLPDEETWAIAAALAAGLAHAHSRDVVHRDLKPANVLFDEEGRAKLADFGIARMAVGEGTLTEAGTVLGTATYISPEQAAGAPATPASDVYSFGVLLYRMLTGRLPFESSDPMELVALHRDAPVPPLATIRDDAPGILESTATASLAKDPADRPQNGGELLTALGVPAGTGLTTAAGMGLADPDATRVLPGAAVPPPSGPGPRPPGRSRAPLVVAGLLVLGLAGGALAYGLTRPESVPARVDTGPAITLPKQTTKKQKTQSTTAAASTTTPSTSTAQTTTRATTRTTTTTPAPPPPTTTVAPPPTTTVAPPPTTDTVATTTAALPPTTTATP